MTTTSLDLDALVASHIITENQKQEIIIWNQKTKNSEGSSRLINILASFGAIVTGLGVILLIAANWDTMSDMMKTILMIGSTGLTYIGAYQWTYHNLNYPKTGQALFLLGAMLYGASIFLLGQIYNLGGTFADALLIWAIPVILLAYATRFFTIFFLSIILIYSYIFGEIIDSFEFTGFVIANIFIAIGYLSLTLLRYHKGIYQHFSHVLSWTGGASILGGLFAYTFLDFWRYGGDSWYDGRNISATMWILFSIVGVGVLAIAIDIIRKKKFETITDRSLVVGLIPLALIFGYTFANIHSGNMSTFIDRSEDATMFIPTIAMNILFLSILVLMLYIGVHRDNRSIVNVAMIYVALYLFGKYIAFAYDSKIDGAYIFIGGGIACIAVTILIEKIRRHLVQSMN